MAVYDDQEPAPLLHCYRCHCESPQIWFTQGYTVEPDDLPCCDICGRLHDMRD